MHGTIGLFIIDTKTGEICEFGPVFGSDLGLYDNVIRREGEPTANEILAKTLSNLGILVASAGVASRKRAGPITYDRLDACIWATQQKLEQFSKNAAQKAIKTEAFEAVQDTIADFFAQQATGNYSRHFSAFFQDISTADGPVEYFLEYGVKPLLEKDLTNFLSENYPQVDHVQFTACVLRECLASIKEIFSPEYSQALAQKIGIATERSITAYNSADAAIDIFQKFFQDSICRSIEKSFYATIRQHPTHIMTDKPESKKAIANIASDFGEAANVINGNWLWSHSQSDKNLMYALLYDSAPEAFPRMCQLLNDSQFSAFSEENIIKVAVDLGLIDSSVLENLETASLDALDKDVFIKGQGVLGQAVSMVNLKDLLIAVRMGNTDSVRQCVGKGMKDPENAENVMQGKVLAFQERLKGRAVECEDGRIYETTDRLFVCYDAVADRFEIPFGYAKIPVKSMSDTSDPAAVISGYDGETGMPRTPPIEKDYLGRLEDFYRRTGFVQACKTIMLTPPWETLSALLRTKDPVKFYIGLEYSALLIEDARTEALKTDSLFFDDEKFKYDSHSKSFFYPASMGQEVEKLAAEIKEKYVERIENDPALADLRQRFSALSLCAAGESTATAPGQEKPEVKA